MRLRVSDGTPGCYQKIHPLCRSARKPADLCCQHVLAGWSPERSISHAAEHVQFPPACAPQAHLKLEALPHIQGSSSCRWPVPNLPLQETHEALELFARLSHCRG